MVEKNFNKLKKLAFIEIVRPLIEGMEKLAEALGFEVPLPWMTMPSDSKMRLRATPPPPIAG